MAAAITACVMQHFGEPIYSTDIILVIKVNVYNI